MTNNYEDILFDKTDGKKIIAKYKSGIITIEDNINRYFLITMTQELISSFQIGGFGPQNRYTQRTLYYIFKKFIIIEYYHEQHNLYPNITIIKHDLPNHVLFTIKNIGSNRFDIQNLISIYSKNPEYFKHDKEDYYEEQLKILEQEKLSLKNKQFELDQLLLEVSSNFKEDKRKIILAKLKLAKIKTELDEEIFKFELEKNNYNYIDKYIDSLID